MYLENNIPAMKNEFNTTKKHFFLFTTARYNSIYLKTNISHFKKNNFESKTNFIMLKFFII